MSSTPNFFGPSYFEVALEGELALCSPEKILLRKSVGLEGPRFRVKTTFQHSARVRNQHQHPIN